MRRLLVIILALLFAANAFSADFGFLIDQKIEVIEELFTYTPSINPWFSWNGDNGFSVYLSAILPYKFSSYSKKDAETSGWKFIPELSRFAFGYQNKRGISFEAGRIYYNDVLGLAASGLFDGLSFKAVTSIGSISAGAFYTGFLYKETAKVLMTDNDKENYQVAWDFNDSFGNYFASQRALASFRWDIPVGAASTFSFEALAQFDLNSKNDAILHSQYGALQFEIFPVNMIKVTAGALFEAMQNKDGDFSAAFGALAQVSINLPTVINDQLSIKIRSASGALDDTFTPFTPIILNPQGSVFSGTMAGLTVAAIEYNVRIIKSLYAGCEFNYFMRTLDDNSKDEFLYGGELFASLAWQPFEDMRVTLGGGAFFPQLGNIDGKTSWKIIAGLALSL